MARTLLLSDGSQSTQGVDANEILINFLISELDKNLFFRVYISREKRDVRSPHVSNSDQYLIFEKIKVDWFSTFKNLSNLLNSIAYLYLLVFVVPTQIRQLKKLILKKKVSKIWIIITSPQVIFLANKLIKKYGDIDIYSSVWDSPEEFSIMLNMPGLIRKKMMKDFSYIMNHSVKLGVSSINMKNEYETRFNKRCFVLQGDVSSISVKEDLRSNSSDYLIIGFAGTNYTPEVWNALFMAFDLIGWKLKGKDIKIRIIGNSILFSPPSDCMVEYLGKQTVNKTVEILSESFINFVPYRFGVVSKYGSSVSFPSKINTYLAAMKPIFTIAPEYSTPYQFVKEFELGISCSSLLPEDILLSLNDFDLSEKKYRQYILNCEKIYNESFHPEVFRKRFEQFIL